MMKRRAIGDLGPAAPNAKRTFSASFGSTPSSSL